MTPLTGAARFVLASAALTPVRRAASPVRRAASALAAVGATVPAEASVYVALVAAEPSPPAPGLHVLRRRRRVALHPALGGMALKD